MATTVEAILTELERVFPAIRQGGFGSLVNSTQGLEPLSVAADFEDKKDWTKLEPDWLDRVPCGLGTALSFLSDEAICFYIPAFLTADLKGKLKRADPAFALTHGFDEFYRDMRIRPREERTWTDYGRERWARLTGEQALAIVHYLEWRVERGGLTQEYDVAEALKNYWYGRAAGRESDETVAP